MKPDSRGPGYGLAKDRLADRFYEQNRLGLRDDLAAVALDADTEVGPDRVLHLGSSSGGGRKKDLDNPHSCCQRHFLLSCPPTGQPLHEARGYSKERGTKPLWPGVGPFHALRLVFGGVWLPHQEARTPKEHALAARMGKSPRRQCRRPATPKQRRGTGRQSDDGRTSSWQRVTTPLGGTLTDTFVGITVGSDRQRRLPPFAEAAPSPWPISRRQRHCRRRWLADA